MKSTTTTLFAALLLTGLSSLGIAAEPATSADQDAATIVAKAPGLTRAQVRADFIAARDAGELIVGENGEKANEINPQQYPAHAPHVASLSRAEVKQQLIDAQRKGALDINDAADPDRAPHRTGI